MPLANVSNFAITPFVDLVVSSELGLYCPFGDFFIDPLRPVHRALVTHGHSDHARRGSKEYLTQENGVGILKERLGRNQSISGIPYNQEIRIKDAIVSFHPAGHILGSSQIRIEVNGEVWVVSGDYKTTPDPTCEPFTPVRCHTFVSESTFALPIYHWETEAELVRQIQSFVNQNKKDNVLTVLCGYSLGKAQRLLKAVDSDNVYLSPSVFRMTKEYESAGVQFKAYREFKGKEKKSDWSNGVLITPPQTIPIDYFQELDIEFRAAFASGWMSQSGSNQMQSYSAGFAMSDHADWEGLNMAVRESGAERIIVHHGFSKPWIRYLCEKGFNVLTFPKN